MTLNVDAPNTGPGTAASAAAAKRDTLGQKDFLELMMTQFRYQDPFKPVDGTQMLGQLAQFSTVNGIDGMQSSLSSIVDSIKSDQMLTGATLVGRSVLVPSTQATLGAEGGVDGAIEVPEGTQQVVVSVKDASGQLVRRYTVDADAGLHDFRWDGALDDGTRAAPGTYRIEAVGVSGGKSSSLELLLADRVGSVTLDAATSGLVLNTATQGTVALAQVRRIF
jgi:flagellar basal-body rod modification protein FlgD